MTLIEDPSPKFSWSNGSCNWLDQVYRHQASNLVARDRWLTNPALWGWWHLGRHLQAEKHMHFLSVTLISPTRRWRMWVPCCHSFTSTVTKAWPIVMVSRFETPWRLTVTMYGPTQSSNVHHYMWYWCLILSTLGSFQSQIVVDRY